MALWETLLALLGSFGFILGVIFGPWGALWGRCGPSFGVGKQLGTPKVPQEPPKRRHPRNPLILLGSLLAPWDDLGCTWAPQVEPKVRKKALLVRSALSRRFQERKRRRPDSHNVLKTIVFIDVLARGSSCHCGTQK